MLRCSCCFFCLFFLTEFLPSLTGGFACEQAELLATCHTNVQCLQPILMQLSRTGDDADCELQPVQGTPDPVKKKQTVKTQSIGFPCTAVSLRSLLPFCFLFWFCRTNEVTGSASIL